MPVQSLQAWAMLIGAPLLHAAAIARGESMVAIAWTPVAVGTLAYLGLVARAVAFLIYFELLDRLGAAEINLIGYLEPVAATGLSYLLLDSLIDLPIVAGFVAIFVGFALIKRGAIRAVTRSVAGRRRLRVPRGTRLPALHRRRLPVESPSGGVTFYAMTAR